MSEPITKAESERLLKLATYASVVTAAILIAAKLGAYLLTNSVSVLASLVDSLMDAGASLINLLAVHYALAPPTGNTAMATARRNPSPGWPRPPSSPAPACS